MENQHETTHVVIEPRQQISQMAEHSNVPVSIRKNCERYKHNITNILSVLDELQEKQREESPKNTDRSTEVENTMKALAERNIKMVAEVDSLTWA